jgi:hypothetical protein
MLIDSCICRLRPGAWKVVCYVAAQHLRVHPEWIDQIQNPATFALGRDLEKLGMIDPTGESGERPYRTVQDGPTIPGERASRFAVISLKDFYEGMRFKRGWRDYGTGLGRSSVPEAIKEAIQSGILVRQHHKSGRGKDMSNLYAIDWDRVQEYDWQRRKSRKMVSRKRTPRSGVNPANSG